MTAPQFSRPGAIDLSGLRKPTGPGVDAPAGSAGGAFVIDVTDEQTLRSEVVERSLSVVVLVSFWSPQIPESMEINAVLERLADEFAGRFLLARVDVAAQPQLAATLGIPQVPLVVAALRGQLAPLISDPLPEPQMRELVRQVLDAAVAGGVAGTAQPSVVDPAPAADDLPASRHPAAEEALLAGDFEAAARSYEQALTQQPGDPEASAGLARAKLLQRVSAADAGQASTAAANRPDDVAAQTLMADLDLIDGRVDAAFGRLLDLVRRSTGAERDATRQHLLELFSVVGDDDPRVLKGRQRLASALF